MIATMMMNMIKMIIFHTVGLPFTFEAINRDQRRQFFARAKKSQARLMWPATSVVSKVPVVFSSGAGRVTGWMGGWMGSVDSSLAAWFMTG